MSPNNTSTTYNPSAQVERMREIIVGRQLARVEQRIDRLEHFVEQPQLSQHDSQHRVEALEARFEAVRDNMQHQVDTLRMEINGEQMNRRQEVHRLAEQIQSTAQQRMHAQQSNEVEQRVGTWLGQWQKSVETHLEQRENWLIQQLRAELQQLRQSLTEESRGERDAIARFTHDLQELQLSVHQRMQLWESNQSTQQQSQQTRLAQIAQAARALAESAAALGGSSSYAIPQP